MSKPKLTVAERDRAAMLASYPATIERNRKEAHACAERVQGASLAELHLYVTNAGLATAAGLLAQRIQALEDAEATIAVLLTAARKEAR